MKNIMVYISPTGSFYNPKHDLTNDAGQLMKVQFENSLALGWKKEDIQLYTNFNFNYGNFKPHVLRSAEFYTQKPQVSKINAIIKIFDNRHITRGELHWFHDLDAFQLDPILEKEISIAENEIAVTEYGGLSFRGQPMLSTGTIFFKSGSRDIFKKIKELAYKKRIGAEEALSLLVQSDKSIKGRVKKINHTYNFIGHNLKVTYAKATKPLKVVHFHPVVKKTTLFGLGKQNDLKFFRGENQLKTRLITTRLIKILRYHRIG